MTGPARADRIVVDSSVAFKWFSRDGETRVEDALELLEWHRAGDALLIVPAHLPAEVINALRYSGLDSVTVQRAAAALDGLDLVVVPLGSQLTQLATELAFSHRLTIHDALFAALAALLDAELVTADRAHARVTECAITLLR